MYASLTIVTWGPWGLFGVEKFELVRKIVTASQTSHGTAMESMRITYTSSVTPEALAMENRTRAHRQATIVRNESENKMK